MLTTSWFRMTKVLEPSIMTNVYFVRRCHPNLNYLISGFAMFCQLLKSHILVPAFEKNLQIPIRIQCILYNIFMHILLK